MKLAFIQLEGFRGVKDRLRLDLASGFSVLVGPNGSGKSTVCDGVEFALTGSIGRQTDPKDKGESLKDYLWWRGGGAATKHCVTLGIVGDDGEVFTVERGPGGLTEQSRSNLVRLAPRDETASPDQAALFCRSFLFRSETIAELSLDMPEAARIDLVRRLMGSADFSATQSKLTEAARLLESSSKELERRYQELRGKLEEQRQKIAKIRAETERSQDLQQAVDFLRSRIINGPDPLSDLLTVASRHLATLRLHEKSLKDLDSRLTGFSDFQIVGAEAAERDKDVVARSKSISAIEEQIRASSESRARLEEQIAQLRLQEPLLTAVSELVGLGRRLKLDQGHCPLCGSEMSEEAFLKHLEAKERQLAKHGEAVEVLMAQRSALSNTLGELSVRLESEQNLRRADESRAASLRRQLSEMDQSLRQFDFDLSQDREALQKDVLERIEQASKDSEDLGQAIAIVSSSISAGSLAQEEKIATELQQQIVELEHQSSARRSARDHIKEIADQISRISREIVEDRLSSLAPLFQELYQRLRPHVTWREISFALRGDIKHFLSLRVGNDLSPGLMFSSGQRRAAGLAFLLSLNLASTRWPLRTMVLDDPVQHIDDFRALHLVELLSAIRHTGRQIICTVEDPALGDLLCRRLRSKVDDLGVMYSLEYVDGQGVRERSRTPVEPLPLLTLKSA